MLIMVELLNVALELLIIIEVLIVALGLLITVELLVMLRLSTTVEWLMT